MNFKERYLSVLNIVKTDIEQVSRSLTNYVPDIEPLKSQVKGILQSPSKHIRPLVSFLYLKANGYNITEEQIAYQTAIEIVHNASLIHDDVIDESKTRRGAETLNETFSNRIAVLAGDYLLSAGLKILIELKKTELIEMFSDTLKIMTSGEFNQYFNLYKIPSLEDYLKKTEQKTAQLFQTAITGSLILADSNDNGLEFAKNFGIAFQIRDDLINAENTQTDLKDGVYTAPVIFSGSTTITKEGIEKTKDLLNNYTNKAIKSIEHIENNIYKSAIIDLTKILRET